MRVRHTLFACALAAFVGAAAADEAPGQLSRAERIDQLHAELLEADPEDWRGIEADLWELWSQSGSPAMDLLLVRGRRALDAGDFPRAIEHFSALIDSAPAFAEGWNARATAHYLNGSFGLSIADIRQTLVLNPRHFGALSGLGMIYERTDNLQGALAAYRAALAVHPHRPDIIKAVERLSLALRGEDI